MQRYKNIKPERPDGLAEWIKRARSHTFVPSITNVKEYGTKWFNWWHAIQPTSRHIESSRKLSQVGHHDLAGVVLCGPNGFLNIVKSLSWWRCAIKLDSDMADWSDSVDDVLWVLKHASGCV